MQTTYFTGQFCSCFSLTLVVLIHSEWFTFQWENLSSLNTRYWFWLSKTERDYSHFFLKGKKTLLNFFHKIRMWLAFDYRWATGVTFCLLCTMAPKRQRDRLWKMLSIIFINPSPSRWASQPMHVGLLLFLLFTSMTSWPLVCVGWHPAETRLYTL